MNPDRYARNIFKNVFFIIAVVIFIAQFIVQQVTNPLFWSKFVLVSGPLVLILLLTAIITGILKTRKK